MAEKSAHVSLCPAPSSERPWCQWKICPSRASSYLAALFLFHSLPLCLRVPLTTYTNFWPLSPVYTPFPIFNCFHTDRYLLQASCLTQALNPSILWQFLTTLFTSSMKPGNNGALFPLFFILPSPCFFLDIADTIWCFSNWKSGLFSVWIIPEMTGEEEALQTPFGLHKKKDSILLFFLPILKIEPLVFCIVILPDLMSHSSQTLHINMFMYLLAWLGS